MTTETIKITDDIIRNKFYEILRNGDIKEPKFFDSDGDSDDLDIEKSKTHKEELIKEIGFDNIDDYSDTLIRLNNNSISKEDKSRIKRHEFLREHFVKEVKNLINEKEQNIYQLNSFYKTIYDQVSKIAKDPVTAIYYAIGGDINLVEALLTNLEVDPNTEFSKYRDNNFLEVACHKENKEMVKLLLEKGANPISGFYKHVKLFKAREEIGFDNIDDYSDALIRLNNNSISEEDKSRIKRHEFFRERFVKEFNAFIEGPNKDIYNVYSEVYVNINNIARNPRDFTAEAIQKGDYDLVDTLLTALNIDPNEVAYASDKSGILLYFACINNQKEIARLLFEKGANVKFANEFNMIPLYTAIEAKHLGMVEFLLENGADPNYMGSNDVSCLEIATFENKDIAMVTKLLDYRANMEVTNIYHEKTIFEQLTYLARSYYAESHEEKQNLIEMIKVFLQYGASPDVGYKGQMIRDMEVIYKPLRTLLKLESAFRKNDYKAIDKKDLASFVQWKSEIWTVKDVSKNEYIKSLLGLNTFLKQVNLDSDDSIKQPLIKVREKMVKLATSLKSTCLLKIANIIDSNVEDVIVLPEDVIKAMTEYGLLPVETTGEVAAHTDLV